MLIKNLPFYWRLKTENQPHELIPQNYPFVFEVMPDIGLLIEKRSPELSRHLKQVYKEDYNIGYIQESNTLARPYYTDLRDSIFRILNEENDYKRILEIGCGGALILKDLQEKSYSVTGVDPSPMSSRAAIEYKLRIIGDFFGPKTFETEKFDFIYHSDVLEHVEDPVGFLKTQVNVLDENGMLFVSVPDATDSIRMGDISMAMHQHLNHFDMISLSNTLKLAGLSEIRIEKAGYGGSLYGFGKKVSGRTSSIESNPEVLTFLEKAKIRAERVAGKLRSLPESTGIYVPNRAFAYLFYAFETPSFRIFDDTPHWYGRYFDGYQRKVENMQDLIRNPSPVVVIMSLTFDKVIKEKIIRLGYQGEILTLRELLEN